jgi:hypothetical protein
LKSAYCVAISPIPQGQLDGSRDSKVRLHF